MSIAPKTVEHAPKGLGRPWYPYLIYKAEIVSAVPIVDETGLSMEWQLRAVGPVNREHVGIRRWFKHIRATRSLGHAPTHRDQHEQRRDMTTTHPPCYDPPNGGVPPKGRARD